MAIVPNVKCYEKAKDIYIKRVKDFTLKQFNLIIKLNNEYNKCNSEIILFHYLMMN